MTGTLFLKRFNNAFKMSAKQKEVFNQLSATFSTQTIKKWEAMVETWEVNPQAPNPYKEPESGELFFLCTFYSIVYLICVVETTLHDVRLELAKEEAAQVALGNMPCHKISMSAFLIIGFELEDSQYVKSVAPFNGCLTFSLDIFFAPRLPR